MAKQKFITRTLKTTRASILCMDTEMAEPLNKTVVLSGTFKNDEDILKQARKEIDKGAIKAVAVVTVNVEENIYRMPETYFIQNAEIVTK